MKTARTAITMIGDHLRTVYDARGRTGVADGEAEVAEPGLER